MKKWWIVALSLAFASVADAAAQGSRVALKDGEGKMFGHALLCNSCEKASAGDKKCHEGAENGWLDGKHCGACLLKTNWGVLIRYSRDLMITGRLRLDDGSPAKKHYIKVFLPNGWGHRTQADDDGKFRVRLGATIDREKGDPLVVDLGDRVDVQHEGNNQFSIFLMPDAFTPCSEDGK